jgi:UDP-glucose 4-epimerase
VSDEVQNAKRRRAAVRARAPQPSPGSAPDTELIEPSTRELPANGAGAAALAPPDHAALSERPTTPAPALAADGAVIITGIVGRMGLLVARKLHRSGAVIGIDRRKFEGKPEDIVHHQIDLRRRKTRDIFRAGGIRAVVHLGVMHNLRESDKTHHEWNVVGFQKLLEYLSQYNVPKLVVLSSATLYGPSPDNPQFLTEEAPLLGAQEFSRIRDLVEVDMLAQSFFWRHPEVETVILRPCHILGRVRNAPSNFCRMERPLTVLGFDPMLQVIHERDVVEAISLALRPGARGIFNLRGPGELPLSRMLRMVGKRPIAVPGPLITGLAGSLWSSRAAGFPVPEIDHLRYICMVDDTRARQQLGFHPKYDMEQTLRAVFSER